MRVSNVRVYGLPESIYASGYPMKLVPPRQNEFCVAVTKIQDAIDISDFENPHIKRAIKLASCKTGTGHDNFLNGVIVQFDVPLTKSFSPEFQRYHFLDFVSSMSLVHCATKMNFSAIANDNAIYPSLVQAQELVSSFNTGKIDRDTLVDNLPCCIELTARMTTNYRQLKTIYQQRKNHPIKKWRYFCKWIESLPMADKFICGGEQYKGSEPI